MAGELRDAIEKKADELGLKDIDYVKEALKWQYNWIGLAGAGLFALVSGTGLPLVLAAGVELMYVALVPQSSAFRRLVRSWKYAAEKRRHDERLALALRELPGELRSRYEGVCAIARTIRENYQRLSSTSQIFTRQMNDRLAGLLHSYLRLLHAAHLHREYLRTVNPDTIKREISTLEHAMEKDPPKVQEINRRRVEILNKRVEKFNKIHENREVIDAQCASIEDVLELIRDQSVTMRDPQQVSDQLETLVHDVEQTEETVREVEAIFEMGASEINVPGAFDALTATAPSEEPGTRQRTRVRN